MNEVMNEDELADIPIESCPDFYKASKNGYIWNTKTKYMLKGSIRQGYPSVLMTSKETKKSYCVHRLVAMAWIPNPDNKYMVNHKDGDKTNNSVDNLEWVSHKENVQHALENKLKIPHKTRISQHNKKDGTLIEVFDSVKEAAEKTGCNSKKIPSACNGKRKTHGGYIWKYIDKKREDPPKDGKIYKNFTNYLITPDGRVYSTRINRYLKLHKKTNGYTSIGLCDNGVRKEFYIHRLVSELFIPNPDNKSYVNHINAIKDDNRIDNLEWVSPTENMKHAHETLFFGYRKINKCDLNNNIITTYNSVRKASDDTNISGIEIDNACKNKQQTAGGYKWKYL